MPNLLGDSRTTLLTVQIENNNKKITLSTYHSLRMVSLIKPPRPSDIDFLCPATFLAILRPEDISRTLLQLLVPFMQQLKLLPPLPCRSIQVNQSFILQSQKFTRVLRKNLIIKISKKPNILARLPSRQRDICVERC
jgi:hypothetical protein